MKHHKMAAGVCGAWLLAIGPAAFWMPPRAAAPRRSGGGPVAGDYSCLKSRMSFSPVVGPAGPLMIIRYDPSVIGTIKLDGKGGYRSFKKTGRYSFDAARRKFTFVSGPLKGWPVVYEVSKGTPMLRLAATQNGTVKKNTQVGEHVCRCRTSRKFPDSAAPEGVVGQDGKITPTRTGKLNGGARGTLTFKEEWGSSSIVDVDVATGRVQSRFEGRDAFRSAQGETAFINRSGALVIAGRGGTAVKTIPVSQKEGRPQLPFCRAMAPGSPFASIRSTTTRASSSPPEMAAVSLNLRT